MYLGIWRREGPRVPFKTFYGEKLQTAPRACNLSWQPATINLNRGRIFVGGADSTTGNTLSWQAHDLKMMHLIRLLILSTGTYWSPLLLPLWLRSQLPVNFHCRCSLRCRPFTKSNIPICHCATWQNVRLKALLTCSTEAKADNARPDKSLYKQRPFGV